MRAARELPRGARLVRAASQHWTRADGVTGRRAGWSWSSLRRGSSTGRATSTEGVDWSTRAAEHAEAADNRAALGHAYFLLHLNRISLGETGRRARPSGAAHARGSR